MRNGMNCDFAELDPIVFAIARKGLISPNLIFCGVVRVESLSCNVYIKGNYIKVTCDVEDEGIELEIVNIPFSTIRQKTDEYNVFLSLLASEIIIGVSAKGLLPYAFCHLD